MSWLFQKFANELVAQDVPTEGEPHCFWCGAVSWNTHRDYSLALREAGDTFAPRTMGDRVRFHGFELVPDEDIPDGEIRFRLK